MRSIAPGNRPVKNMGWPLGCERVANIPSRLGHSLGPGPGQYEFLYRCEDTAELNEALEIFSEILVPKSALRSATSKDGEATDLELVVHDGPKHSTWLSRGTEGKTRVDWAFLVWNPAGWHRWFNNPKSRFRFGNSNFRRPVPPPRICVYLTEDGPIVWQDVLVPPNVRVIDKRAEAAPVKLEKDGMVTGTVFDMSTGQPIAGAQIALAQRNDQKEWQEVVHGETNDVGAFDIVNIPPGRYSVRIRAEGYASLAQGSYDNKGTTYHEVAAQLVRDASLKGTVTDTAGAPLPGVKVSARNTLAINGLGYGCADAEPVLTDAEGRFELRGLPEGFTQLRCRFGALHQVTPVFELYEVTRFARSSRKEIRIVMEGTGLVRVKVTGKDGGRRSRRPPHVHLGPAGGSVIGSWGGSARCDKEGIVEFKGVPPGEYVVSTMPIDLVKDEEAPNVKRISVKAGGTIEVSITK